MINISDIYKLLIRGPSLTKNNKQLKIRTEEGIKNIYINRRKVKR